LDLPRDGGLSNPQTVSRTTEAAFLKNHQEQAEFIQHDRNSDAKFASRQPRTGIGRKERGDDMYNVILKAR
jgi:hypothetical protein